MVIRGEMIAAYLGAYKLYAISKFSKSLFVPTLEILRIRKAKRLIIRKATILYGGSTQNDNKRQEA